jgi:hypothetical protein
MAGSVAEGRSVGRLGRTPTGRGRLPGEAGFLLVEVLVAMVLLGVGVSGALVLLGQASRAMHRAGELSGSAPLAALLAEAGPEGMGIPESMEGAGGDGDGDPDRAVAWWWDDGGLELRLGPAAPGTGKVGRRVRVVWLELLPLWEPQILGTEG